MGYWCDISSSILSFGKNQSPNRTHLNLLSNFLYLHPAQLTLNHELWLLSYLSPHTFTNTHLHSQLHSSAHTFTLKQTSHSLTHSDSNTHRQNIHTLKDSYKVPTLIKCDNQNGETAEGRNSLIRKCSKRLNFFFWAVCCDAGGNYTPPPSSFLLFSMQNFSSSINGGFFCLLRELCLFVTKYEPRRSCRARLPLTFDWSLDVDLVSSQMKRFCFGSESDRPWLLMEHLGRPQSSLDTNLGQLFSLYHQRAHEPE